MKIEAIVLICDGTPDRQGDLYDINGLHQSQNKIPVSIEGPGYGASLYQPAITETEIEIVGTLVYMVFNIPVEEFVNIKMLTPCINGIIHKREGNLIKQFTINHITLGPGNQDDRIEKLQWAKYYETECQHEPVQMIYSSFCKKCNANLP